MLSAAADQKRPWVSVGSFMPFVHDICCTSCRHCSTRPAGTLGSSDRVSEDWPGSGGVRGQLFGTQAITGRAGSAGLLPGETATGAASLMASCGSTSLGSGLLILGVPWLSLCDFVATNVALRQAQGPGPLQQHKWFHTQQRQPAECVTCCGTHALCATAAAGLYRCPCPASKQYLLRMYLGGSVTQWPRAKPCTCSWERPRSLLWLTACCYSLVPHTGFAACRMQHDNQCAVEWSRRWPRHDFFPPAAAQPAVQVVQPQRSTSPHLRASRLQCSCSLPACAPWRGWQLGPSRRRPEDVSE